MKLVHILIPILFLFSIFQISAFAQNEDVFSLLEAIQIGDEISSTTLNQGTKIENTGFGEINKEVYTFTSELYSNPHIVYLNSRRVTFVQLTIPTSAQVKYKKLFISLGKPETTIPKTRSEVLMGFPQKGIAFIIDDYSGSVLRVQKFEPKSVINFTQSEGKNFQPIDSKATTSTTSPTLNPVQDMQQLTTLLITGVIFLLLVTGFLFWRRRRKTKETPQSPTV